MSLDGTIKLVLRDSTSYQMLLELVDRLETIDALREGLNEIDAGKGIGLEGARKAEPRKYGLSI